MVLDSLSETTKHVMDGASMLVVVGTFSSVLPHVAALLTVIWLAIRIWESDTLRAMTGRPVLGRRDDG